MARKGYVKLYRQIVDDDVWRDARKLKLWILCLTKANHKENTITIGNQVINIKPGQFVTGREELAYEYNRGSTAKNMVTSISLYKWLENFQKTQKIYIKKTTKYSVVTILNWDKYQQ